MSWKTYLNIRLETTDMFYARIPRYIEDGHIGLRLLRLFDVPFLFNGFKDQEILAANGLTNPISSSWLSVWWWIKKTFTLIYCIKCDSKRIGFIGLYNLKLGQSAEMTLVIFDKDKRRKGNGTKAFHIFTQNLKRCDMIEKITVKVKEDNYASIAFWTGLGFKDMHSLNGMRVMSIDLKNI